MPPVQVKDPRTLPQSEFPFLVNAGSSADLIAEAIEWWDHSQVNHSMFAINQGKFIWQGMNNFYGERPMDAYLKKGGLIKFYQLVEVSEEFKGALSRYCISRIKAPWWEHLYNWLGIIGQAIGIHDISTPGLEYCSQDVIHGLKAACMYLPNKSFAAILNMDNNLNPAALDKYFLANDQVFRLAYIWDSKNGVTV